MCVCVWWGGACLMRPRSHRGDVTFPGSHGNRTRSAVSSVLGEARSTAHSKGRGGPLPVGGQVLVLLLLPGFLPSLVLVGNKHTGNRPRSPASPAARPPPCRCEPLVLPSEPSRASLPPCPQPGARPSAPVASAHPPGETAERVVGAPGAGEDRRGDGDRGRRGRGGRAPRSRAGRAQRRRQVATNFPWTFLAPLRLGVPPWSLKLATLKPNAYPAHTWASLSASVSVGEARPRRSPQAFRGSPRPTL